MLPPGLGNLPAQLDGFVGRERELVELADCLQRGRLVTVNGPGGCGKTRLALELATRTRGEHRDGAWLIELASIQDPGLLQHQVAATLGIEETSSETLAQAQLKALRSRRLLLVLDNCEHMAEACAELAETLLEHCSDVRILATSREILQCRGEIAYRLAPMSLQSKTRDAVSEAASLFLERARSSAPDLEVRPSTMAAIAHVCEVVEGMPLAIELAARQARYMPVEEIGDRLRDRFHLLHATGRTKEPRHSSLWAAIDWSYTLLSEVEKTVFRRLSVLRGGIDVDGALAVCAWPSGQEATMLGVLAALDAKSMIAPMDRSGPRARFRQLETLRLFGREQLDLAGETWATEERLIAWLADLAGPGQEAFRATSEWARIGEERDNLLAATEAAVAHGSDLQTVLAIALEACWRRRGHFAEGFPVLEDALEHGGAPPPHREEAQLSLARLALMHGRPREAVEKVAGVVDSWRGRSGPGPFLRALLLLMMAEMEAGDIGSMRMHAAEAREFCSQLADPRQRAMTLNNVARVLTMAGDLGQAEIALREAQHAAGGDDDPRLPATFAQTTGMLAYIRRNLVAARAHFAEALRLTSELDHSTAVAAVEGLALVAFWNGEHPYALLLRGGGLEMRRQWPYVPSHRWWRGQLADLERGCRQRLGRTRTSAILAAGHRLDPERVMACALDPTLAESEELVSPLSDREQEVALLVAEGLGNREIGQRLGLSHRTVESHLESVRRKLRMTSRTEIAVWAARELGSSDSGPSDPPAPRQFALGSP